MKIAGETHFAAWHVPQCPLVIEYSSALLAEIDRVVHEAFYSAPRGGVETAGLLFGIHLEGVLRITAIRPMECEHLHGPGFLVSDKDLMNLHALLERSSRDPILHGSTLAGWYHSHTRSGIFLSEADLELHRRFFPESWQVALVLRPSPHGVTRAGFFFQEAGGTIHSRECYREFELAEAEPAGPGTQLTLSPLPATHRPELGLTAPLKPTGPPISMRANALPEAAARRVPVLPSTAAMANRLRSPDAVAGKSKGRYWPWVVAGLVMGIGGASWYQSGTPRPPSPTRAAPLHLRVTDQSGLLNIEWDRNTLAATELLGGNLGIRDGETRTNLPLDRAAIKAGSFQLVRHSPKVRVTLQIRVLGAAPIEEVTEFSGPMPQPVEAAEVSPRAPDADTARRPEAGSENAVAETTAVVRPADRPSDKKDQRSKQEPSSDSTRREPPSTPAAPTSPANTAAPPRQQTAEAARPPAPAMISAARPPSDTPFTPAASQPAQNTPFLPRPVPAALQPEGSGTAANSAPASSATQKAAPVQPPKPIAAPLSGHWVHGADGPSGSPFPPESLLLTLTESAGQLHGSFSGSYKVPKNRKVNGRVDFQFAGPASTGSARFPFQAADGSKGEVEIIRVPGHIDTIEVVWHSSRDQITFDDVFQRVP
jgi:proteasome lid subunit RPN8/RPN11